MGIAGLILVPHLSKSGKSFLFYSCTSDVIVISRNSQWVKSCKNFQSLPVQVFRGSWLESLYRYAIKTSFIFDEFQIDFNLWALVKCMIMVEFALKMNQHSLI